MTKLILIVNPYRDPNPLRDIELQHCLEANLCLGCFDDIRLVSSEWPTMNDYFECFEPDAINIWANLDIEFDHSISLAHSIPGKTLWALTRWEPQTDGTWQNWGRCDSQDVFIVRGRSPIDFPYRPGIRGVDNRLCFEFSHAGWSVQNPSLSIVTKHHHASAVRNGIEKRAVPGPYKTVPISRL